MLVRRYALPLLLLTLVLEWSAGCPAEDATANVPAQPVSDAAPHDTDARQNPSTAQLPATRVARPRIHHVPGQGIEQTVQRMTRGLGLDTAQQTQLRKILWDEQQQARRLREHAGPDVAWASATAAIVEQTKSRIRAILTGEQKNRYFQDVPRQDLAPAQADLQHYMQLQESKRQQSDAAPK